MRCDWDEIFVRDRRESHQIKEVCTQALDSQLSGSDICRSEGDPAAEINKTPMVKIEAFVEYRIEILRERAFRSVISITKSEHLLHSCQLQDTNRSYAVGADGAWM